MITYLSFALAITLLIASPGPVVALVLADGRGTWPTWTILGGILSAQILLACALLMLYLALDVNTLVLEWGRLLGGLYLAWLGLSTLRASGNAAQCSETGSRQRFWRTLRVGLSNPKDILFFLAFLPSFILPGQSFARQACILALIWAVIDLSVLSTYATLSQRLFRLDTGKALLTWVPGMCLLALGLYSGLQGLHALSGQA